MVPREELAPQVVVDGLADSYAAFLKVARLYLGADIEKPFYELNEAFKKAIDAALTFCRGWNISSFSESSAAAPEDRSVR